MFLGLAVFAILALVLSIIVIRAVKALFRLLTGGKKDEKKTEEKTQPEKEKAAKSETKEKSEKESVEEAKSESEQHEKSPELESDPAEDLIRNRYSEATLQGITESFASEGTMMEIDPKTVADLCVGSSGILSSGFPAGQTCTRENKNDQENYSSEKIHIRVTELP